jgi:nitrite reductase/ring-hydroxylating ferredoxin subunit
MRLISALERAAGLDQAVALGQRAARALRPGRARDILNGVWLGHPLHPVLVQAPVGAWLSASVLDAWPGADPAGAAARRLTAFGLAAAVPAALAGAADWSEQHEQQLRVGVVHAAANTAAIGLYTLSLLTRSRRGARALRLSGLAVAGAGGMLGGHISFRLAGGANHAEAVPHLVEPGWHDLMPAAGLADGKPARAMLGEVPVVVVRQGARLHALAGRCSHMDGPLWESDLAAGCLECPWHGSIFRVTDGAVARGPATAPQPVFETRVRDGVIQVQLPGAG